MDYINLNSFLKFGYFLNYKFPSYEVDFSNCNPVLYEYYKEEELLKKGIHLWNKTINSQFNLNQKHVVPLSGGLDSRAILGTLLKYTDASNIHTYTFGTPGSYDFDIGNQIARTVGTKHYNFDLTKSKYDQTNLLSVSKRIDHQTLLFLHPPTEILDDLYSDFNIWSGTIIDVFFGRHFHENISRNLNDAILNSFKENIYVKSIDLTNINERLFFKYVDYDSSVFKIHDIEHIIDLQNRQLKFIAPHVLMKGFQYKTLLNKEFTDFALSINKKYYNKQSFYIKMLLNEFPFLFSFPNKTNYGLSFKPSKKDLFNSFFKRGISFLKRKINLKFFDPGINYIDFNSGIRERKDLNEIIYNNLMDLKNRKIIDWIDFDKLWYNHNILKKDHSDALLTLSSLEIHLKAGKKL